MLPEAGHSPKSVRNASEVHRMLHAFDRSTWGADDAPSAPLLKLWVVDQRGDVANLAKRDVRAGQPLHHCCEADILKRILNERLQRGTINNARTVCSKSWIVRQFGPVQNAFAQPVPLRIRLSSKVNP